VHEARLNGFSVVPIPGASAVIAALSVSGLPTDKFRFIGFLPSKSSQRKTVIEALKAVTETIVCYEAPHRIAKTIEDFSAIFGSQRLAFMAREITKKFETYLHGNLRDLLDQVKEDTNQQRGEIVLVIAGQEKIGETMPADSEKLLGLLIKELPLTKAASIAAKITGGDKKQLYQLALSMQDK
jgi:16S rRNA (cytidine1402-2'-O)-methyltransferase